MLDSKNRYDRRNWLPPDVYKNLNYRVIKTQRPEDGKEVFSIREVYYDADFNITGFSDKPLELSSENLDILFEYVISLEDIFRQPVVIASDLGPKLSILSAKKFREQQRLDMIKQKRSNDE